jgi:hypothetical protein
MSVMDLLLVINVMKSILLIFKLGSFPTDYLFMRIEILFDYSMKNTLFVMFQNYIQQKEQVLKLHSVGRRSLK